MEAPCMHKTKSLCRHQKLMPHQRVSHSSTSPRATLGIPSGPHVFQSTASDKVITETLRTWAPGAVRPRKLPPGCGPGDDGSVSGPLHPSRVRKQPWLQDMPAHCWRTLLSGSPWGPAPLSGFRKDGHSAFQDMQTIYSTYKVSYSFQASLIGQLVNYLPAMQETPVQFLGWEDLLEKG